MTSLSDDWFGDLTSDIKNMDIPQISIPFKELNTSQKKRAIKALRASVSANFQNKLSGKYVRSSFNANASKRSRRSSAITADSVRTQFFENLEDEFIDRMEKASNQWVEFLIVSDTLGKLINHFPGINRSLAYVKEGYDGLLTKIYEELKIHRAKALQVVKSQSDIHFEIALQQEKYKAKQQKLKDQIELIKEQTRLTQEEIDEFRVSKSNMESELQTRSTSSENTLIYIQQLRKIISEHEEVCDEKSETYKSYDNQAKEIASKIDEVSLTIHEYLDYILDTNRKLDETTLAYDDISKKYYSLREKLDESHKKIEEDRDLFERKNKELMEITEKIESIESEQLNIKENLCKLVVGRNIDDPVRLLEIYLRGR